MYRVPTVNNPMMNVPIAAYDTQQEFADYYRYQNITGPKTNAIKKEVAIDLNSKLFQDPADKIFERNNSQRQWYSMPNGSVPSDQTSFAENLYGREYVCKSGSIYMRYNVPFTDDSLACTGFEGDGQLTNFGQLNKS
jgi:hypothetical protein